MPHKNLIINYGEFNLWANKTFAEWLKTIPAELLEKELPSSYPTITKTILHIWGTERFWLHFLQTAAAPKIFTYPFEGSPQEALEGLVKQSQEFSTYVLSLTEADLLKDFTLNASWMQGSIPQYEFIQHCINHSTYHRGQIISMSRMVGLSGQPGTDYNYYNMVSKGNGK